MEKKCEKGAFIAKVGRAKVSKDANLRAFPMGLFHVMLRFRRVVFRSSASVRVLRRAMGLEIYSRNGVAAVTLAGQVRIASELARRQSRTSLASEIVPLLNYRSPQQ